MQRLFFLLLAVLAAISASAADIVEKDIQYRPGAADAYAASRCRVDVARPDSSSGAPVVIWFHGGGLTSGSKTLPAELLGKGYVVVSANYRLMPAVPIDSCIADAAAAVAWARDNAARLGGDPAKIVLSGHSAGGYLSMMLALDKSWLAPHGIDPDSLLAVIPFSGQAITHFAHRDMHGIGNLQPTIDRYAPLYHARRSPVPMILITGGRDIELFGRYEENAYLWRMLRLCDHPAVELYEIDGFDHGAMASPAFHILNNKIKALTHP